MENKFKKQGVGDFVSSSFKLANNGQLVGNMVFILGVVAVFGFVVYLMIGSPQTFIQRLQQNPGSMGGLFIVIQLLPTILISIVVGAIIHSQAGYYQGNSAPYGESVKTGFSKFFFIILAQICLMLAFAVVGGVLGFVAALLGQVHPYLAIGALIAVYIFILYLAFGAMLIFPALVIENLGPIASIQRSFQLSKGSRWTIIGRMLVFGLAVMGILLVVGLIGSFIGQALAGSPAVLILALPVALLYIYFLLSGTAASVVMYFDLRATKESFGIEKLAENFD